MQSKDRKAATAAYKERKVVAGIYAVRCTPTGAYWVGRAPDISTIQNRLWFSLGMGSNPHRHLQAAWREHGPEAFAFDIVEELDDEEVTYVRDRKLKDRLSHWIAVLKAEPI